MHLRQIRLGHRVELDVGQRGRLGVTGILLLRRRVGQRMWFRQLRRAWVATEKQVMWVWHGTRGRAGAVGGVGTIRAGIGRAVVGERLDRLDCWDPLERSAPAAMRTKSARGSCNCSSATRPACPARRSAIASSTSRSMPADTRWSCHMPASRRHVVFPPAFSTAVTSPFVSRAGSRRYRRPRGWAAGPSATSTKSSTVAPGRKDVDHLSSTFIRGAENAIIPHIISNRERHLKQGDG